MACEHSVYCDEAVIGDRRQGVYGFKSFVVKFMIRMAVVSQFVYSGNEHGCSCVCWWGYVNWCPLVGVLIAK